MKCDNCNEELIEDAKFCQKCGEKVASNSNISIKAIISDENTIFSLVLPIIWIFIKLEYLRNLNLNSSHILVKLLSGDAQLIYAAILAEALAPLIITTFIFITKKVKKEPYHDFTKHLFSITAIIFANDIFLLYTDAIYHWM